MDTELKKHLENKARWVRQQVLGMAPRVGAGHVTTAFSQTEMLVSLYQGKLLNLNPAEPKWPERDRFILSKGQGGIGLYPVLADMKFFPLGELDLFNQRGGMLGTHSEWQTPGVELLKGSLGHGLPMATGMALAAKLDGKKHLVVCMTGDGELGEGSNWEAMLTASQMRLGHLVVIVDHNKMATIGKLEDREFACDGPALGPLDKKFEAFGFEVAEFDGHSFDAIFKWFEILKLHDRPLDGPPVAMISHTVKGHGVSFMEGARGWHYKAALGEQYEQAVKELAG